MSIQLIRSELIVNLPTPVDREALTKLSFQLGVAADIGSMPSFEHDGARAGYAVDYFCRAQLMADIIFSSESSFLREDVDRLLSSGNKQCNIGSLGGGPGYDFVAAALVATYKSQQRQQTLPPVVLHATIFDYEHGWAPLVEKMASAVEHTLGGSGAHQHSCHFGGRCDIALPLSHASNAVCEKEANDTDIWFCSYCIAENANKLRDGNFIFFQDLFEASKPNALFVFTETTHRLWPDLAAIANTGFDVAFPQSRGNRQNRQMVLRKRLGATLGQEEFELCKVFERDNEMHKRTIRNGRFRRRQVKKIRGSK
jgi:hypothetical protein